ncbi:hypothetical protein ACHAWU_000607 [Discostella pseudostelligera]|uniref:Aminotransferase class I/classII large domain-containing protein n=1 Tax=Discostella pseudostelligera TaxID=259834 RepID=A0ABD3M7G4_9STRA
MPPSSFVNSVITSSPSSTGATTTATTLFRSSLALGWTPRRSLASSILLLQPLNISAARQSSQLTSTSGMTSPTFSTATTTPATFVSSDAGGRPVMTRNNTGKFVAPAGGGGSGSSSCFRNSWRARFFGSFTHHYKQRSMSISSVSKVGPLFAESNIGDSSASSSSNGSSSSNFSTPEAPSRYFSASSSSTNNEITSATPTTSTGSGRSGSKLSSIRAQAAIQLLPSYIADARAVTKYSPISSPEGALQLSVAENQLCELPIRGMIGIVEGGNYVVEGGEAGGSIAEEKREMTLTDVLSQLASSKYPRPSDTGAENASAGNVFQRDMIYYQPTQGVPSVRRAMANYLQSLLLPSNTQSSSSRKFIPDNIILGAGCNAVLENLCMCLANPGDAALIPTPYYASFEFDLSARAGCHIVPVNTFNHHPDGRTVPSSWSEPIAPEFYYPNRSSLDAAYQRAQMETGRPPRILLLSHPNNPLGICYPPRVVQECIDWCREKEVHLVSDEIYAGSVYRKERTLGEERGQPTFVSVMDLGSRSCDASHNGLGLGPYIHLVYALSKDFALSGLRVGVTYTENEEILLPLQKLNDMCQISSQTQLLVERMMCADAIMDGGDERGSNDDVDSSQKFFDVYMKVNNENIRARCDKLHSFLEDVGIPSLPADSGLFVWMDLREFLPPLADGASEASESIESKEARERHLYLLLMKKYGLLFTPGMSMRSERAGFFRFVFTAASEEEFDLGLVRLRKAVEEMRNR